MKQETALNILKCGHNVFLTGEAGSGKTYTLNLFRDFLKSKNINSDVIALTASTGIASSHIGGTTIHSWSLMGIKDAMSFEEIQQLTQKKTKQKEKIEKAKVLIIDECGMLHRNQFELASQIISYIRQDSRPWGGLQLILTGDFLQLPPVDKNKTAEPDRNRFAFMSPLWKESELKICYLTEQHRNDGGTLNAILNAIRKGTAGQAEVDLLFKNNAHSPNSKAMRLFTHNENVDHINYIELTKINSELKRFIADTEGNEQRLKTLTNSILAPKCLELKKDAKVIFVRNNFDLGFVNGTQGVITGFEEDPESPAGFNPVVLTTDGDKIVVERETWELLETNGKVAASFKQYPLKLAYAITIHKSQGMSLDEARIDCGRSFECGQGYVALSRLKSIEGLYIEDINIQALELNKLAKKADVRFKELSDENELLFSKLSVQELSKAHNAYFRTLL